MVFFYYIYVHHFAITDIYLRELFTNNKDKKRDYSHMSTDLRKQLDTHGVRHLTESFRDPQSDLCPLQVTCVTNFTRVHKSKSI